MWGMAQKDHDIKKSKEFTRKDCAQVCHDHAECIGFDYYPTNKDCFLTKTTWKKVQPTALSNRWVCEKKDGKGSN